MSNHNHLGAFLEALAAAGVHLAEGVQIVPDGELHRARAADDKPGCLSVWYNLHLDSPASGVAGNWRTGAKLTWCGKSQRQLSAKERETLRIRIESDKRRAQVALEARHSDAAARASRIWRQSTPATASHPYLVRKAISPGIARQSGDALVLPVQDFAGQLWGLQFIQPDGGKRFLSGMKKTGCFIPTGGTPDDSRPLWLAEGGATAMTLQALKPGVCVIAACDAGNIASVAQAARTRWPALDIVVCPDFDAVGQTKAKEAAIAARARILPPPELPEGFRGSDWNDWQQFRRQGVAHVA